MARMISSIRSDRPRAQAEPCWPAFSRASARARPWRSTSLRRASRAERRRPASGSASASASSSADSARPSTSADSDRIIKETETPARQARQLALFARRRHGGGAERLALQRSPELRHIFERSPGRAPASPAFYGQSLSCERPWLSKEVPNTFSPSECRRQPVVWSLSAARCADACACVPDPDADTPSSSSGLENIVERLHELWLDADYRCIRRQLDLGHGFY